MTGTRYGYLKPVYEDREPPPALPTPFTQNEWEQGIGVANYGDYVRLYFHLNTQEWDAKINGHLVARFKRGEPVENVGKVTAVLDAKIEEAGL